MEDRREAEISDEFIRKKRRWFVFHVKPRTEKKVANYMRIWKMWHHLPLYTKVTKVQRRKVRTVLPIFPGYVFAWINYDQRLEMIKTHLIVDVIDVLHPRELIHQLRQVSRAIRGAKEIRKVDMFKEGELVRVTEGPFRNVEGYIKRDPGGTTIVLNVEILGQAVEVKISPNMCERVK